MPHQRCSSCGVVSYAPVNGAGAACPECGVPWPATGIDGQDPVERDRRLHELLRMTRTLLDADVAMLSEITEDRETVQLASGDWPGAGSLQGVSAPLQDTFCRRMLEGRIGNVVVDARADEELAALPMAQALDIGSWMGVSIELPDTRLYMLCCLAREVQPSLGQREVKLLSGLAESVRAELQSPVPALD
jgi:GAF domain-containing protein